MNDEFCIALLTAGLLPEDEKARLTADIFEALAQQGHSTPEPLKTIPF